MWLVFDTAAPIDLAALNNEPSRTVRNATTTRSRDGQVVRIKLERPRLTSLASEGATWTVVIGEIVLEPTRPLVIQRNITGPNQANVTIPFEDPRQLHRLTDPELKDTLLVVTALAPARGFLKTQDFVEFSALASSQGVVIQPLADDLTAELDTDTITIGRPDGLTLSTSSAAAKRGDAGSSNSSSAGAQQPAMFDTQSWGYDHQANFNERQTQLMRAAAEVAEHKRMAARLDLARFYLARDLNPEAKAVLDVAMRDERPNADDSTPSVLHAVANLMLNRPEQALKDLANPLVGNQHDAPLWRAFALARQGKWVEAREGFQEAGPSIPTLPVELQRQVLIEAIRASLEVRDFATASKQLSEFDTIGIPRELEPTLAVLTGQVAEGLGHVEEAQAAYRTAADSWDRPQAAQGRLRDLALRYGRGELRRNEMIEGLETLSATWRGDDTEIEVLQLLARLYTEEQRFRDAFYVMRTALRAHPNSNRTRQIQEAAAASFDSLFLAGKGDTMPAIDALSLFYDFRELTPFGRRGDEMIRRLADRLVSVDLLDQAAELLQHQVDHRLEGAARAQVATRLAVVYLMNHKPDRALATLQSTRTAELNNELRTQRLLLESRALSDLGRHELAIEVIADIDTHEAMRLRSDILWAAKRWRDAAEQIELLYGDRWKEWAPLSVLERGDILRAAVGYALGDDGLGLQRFREKYAAKMAEGPDRRVFEVASGPLSAGRAEFSDVAKTIAAVDTLEGFLRDMRARYPDMGAIPPAPPAPISSQTKLEQRDVSFTGALPPAALLE